jgi:hypothetical protein
LVAFPAAECDLHQSVRTRPIPAPWLMRRLPNDVREEGVSVNIFWIVIHFVRFIALE